MAYCTADEIAFEFNTAFDTLTKVKKTTVEGFIAEADAEIDSKIARRYSVPITGTSALLVIKRISRAIVVRRLVPILDVDAGDEKNKSSVSSRMKFDPYEALNDIANGKTLLLDQPKSGIPGAVRSYTAESNIEPTFKRDEESW